MGQINPLLDYGITRCVPQEKFLRSRGWFIEISFRNLCREKCSMTVRDFLRSLQQWNFENERTERPNENRNKEYNKRLTNFINLF